MTSLDADQDVATKVDDLIGVADVNSLRLNSETLEEKKLCTCLNPNNLVLLPESIFSIWLCTTNNVSFRPTLE